MSNIKRLFKMSKRRSNWDELHDGARQVLLKGLLQKRFRRVQDGARSRCIRGGPRERVGFHNILVLLFFVLVKLLSKIIPYANLADGMQLAFQIIDMLFFVAQDLLKERTGCIVSDLGGDPDRVIQLLHGVHL